MLISQIKLEIYLQAQRKEVGLFLCFRCRWLNATHYGALTTSFKQLGAPSIIDFLNKTEAVKDSELLKLAGIGRKGFLYSYEFICEAVTIMKASASKTLYLLGKNESNNEWVDRLNFLIEAL